MNDSAEQSTALQPVGRLGLAFAGLGGIGLLAAAGWNIHHDEVLFNTRGAFDLTRKEWLSFVRELAGFGFGALAVAGACAFRLRSRCGVAWLRSFAGLLGSLVVGWGALAFVAGRFVPLHPDLAELGWIGLAAASAAAFAYRYSSLARSARRDDTRQDPPATAPPGDRSASRWKTFAAAMVVAYIATFGVLSVLRHNAFGTDLHDLGLYDQMFWNTLRGRPFHCTLWQITPQPGVTGDYNLKEFGYNFLGEHCMPVLLLFTPIYALWQDPRTLLLVQTLALGLAGLALYGLAARMLASRALGCLFLFAFLMNPLVQQTNIKDFHADAFEPLFFFLAIGALAERRLWLYWLSLALFMGCKEDVSLTVTALGVFLLVRERRWLLGLGTVLFGAIWYIAAVKGVMESLVRDGEPLRQLYRYRHLLPEGEEASVGAILRTVCLKPHRVAQLVLLDPDRASSLLRLFLPVAALPLCAVTTFIFVLPPLASNLLSGWDIQYSLDLHYSIAILGPLYVAAVCGARNWLYPERKKEPLFPKPKRKREGETILSQAEGRSLRRPHAAAVGAFVLLAVALLGYRYGRFPGGDRFDAEDFRTTEHHRGAQGFVEAIEALPADTAISAHSPIGAHLTGRKTIYVFPETQDATWIVIDTRDQPWPFTSREAFEARVRWLLTEGGWGVARPYEDGYLLLEKGADTARNAETLARLNFKPYR